MYHIVDGGPTYFGVRWFLLSKVLVFTLNTYLRHCIRMYRACIGMYPGARPKSLCDDTIPVDTREIHHDTTYRTPAPSPPDPIHRYTLDTIQIQSIYMYLASRPLLAAASAALARPLCDHRRVSPLLGPHTAHNPTHLAASRHHHQSHQESRQAARAQRERTRVGEEKADPGPGVSRRNPLSRYVRGRGRRETGLKQSRRCTAGDRVPGANQYQYQYQHITDFSSVLHSPVVSVDPKTDRL